MSPRYYAGRSARSQGLPRTIPDGRCSQRSRADFYAGWDDEDLARLAAEESGEAVTREDLDRFKAQALARISTSQVNK